MQFLEAAGLTALVATGAVIGSAFGPLLRSFLERLFGHQFDKRLEDFRYGVRVKEQASKTAEYLAYAWRLKEEQDDAIYVKANQLGWELALYLPADVYRHVRDAVYDPKPDRWVGTALIEVRRHLLKSQAGDLSSEEIALHDPKIRRSMKTDG